MSKTFTEKKVTPLMEDRTGFLRALWKVFLEGKVKSLRSQRFIGPNVDWGVHHQPSIHGRSMHPQVELEFRKAQVRDWYMQQRARMI